MEHVVKIAVCIFICFVFVSNTNGQNDLTYGQTADNNVERRMPLECTYNLTNGYHICDCYNSNTLFTLEELNGIMGNMIICNCRDLLVKRETFRHVDFIGQIHFMNIDRLSLEEHSIAFRITKPSTKIQLKFSNVNIQRIDSYAIDGCVDVVSFDGCRIEKFTAYAMNTHCSPIERISIENTEIGSIDMQAFKKLIINNLVFKNTTFQSNLPSRVFSALIITKQISISHCSFKTIYPHAIHLDVNDFIFADNKIDQFEAEAFSLNVNGRIFIEHNNFLRIDHAALSGIHVGEKMKNLKKEIQFSSNMIGATDSPIRFQTDSNVYLRILDLKFSQVISCDEAERLKQNGFLPQYAELVYFRFGSGNNEYSSLSSIWSTKCVVTSYITIIILLAVVLVLILVIIIVALFYRFLMKRQPTRPIPMVIPDGKTYRETQIMMQIEHAGLLKTNL